MSLAISSVVFTPRGLTSLKDTPFFSIAAASSSAFSTMPLVARQNGPNLEFR